MNIKTKYKLGDIVYFPDYKDDIVKAFHVTKITTSTERMYSGSGGCAGLSEQIWYYDEDNEMKNMHNLYSTMKECKKKLEEYKKRFPTIPCPHCKGEGKVLRGEK
jgi:hypothetical protein